MCSNVDHLTVCGLSATGKYKLRIQNRRFDVNWVTDTAKDSTNAASTSNPSRIPILRRYKSARSTSMGHSYFQARY